MAKRVTLENLADAVAEVIEEYGEGTIKATHEAVKKTAQAGANEINSAASGAVGGKKYVKSWKAKSDNDRIGAHAVIYSNIPGLPHLLEHGHATRNGTRATMEPTPAHPHIGDAVDKINESLEKNIVTAINSANYGV